MGKLIQYITAKATTPALFSGYKIKETDMVYTRYLKFSLPLGWVKVWYKKPLNQILTPKDIVIRTKLSVPDEAKIDEEEPSGTVTVKYIPKSGFFGSPQLEFTDTYKGVLSLEQRKPGAKAEAGSPTEDETLYDQLYEMANKIRRR